MLLAVAWLCTIVALLLDSISLAGRSYVPLLASVVSLALTGSILVIWTWTRRARTKLALAAGALSLLLNTLILSDAAVRLSR